MIFRKSRAGRCELPAPLFRAPNREEGYPVIAVFYIPISDRLKCDKMGRSYSRLGAGMGVAEIGGGLIARDFLKIIRKSRTNHWELSGPAPRPLIANKNIPLSGHFTSRYPIG